MFVLTLAVILLSLGFLFFLRSLVQANQTDELKKAESVVFASIKEMGNNDEELQINELPYYLTYIAYDGATDEVIATNDPFLPLLKESGGKTLHYFEKDFFFDGNLDILYFADTHKIDQRNIIVAVAVNVENDSFSKIFNKLPLALLLLSLPVLLLSFLVSLLITKNTIYPVKKITRTAHSMTTENLDGQLPLSGYDDEIDALSQAFNDLFRRIKADFDRERQFSSDVSHELNTPLTVITGQANLLLRWGKDNPEQLEKSLNAIKNESKSMHVIIENLLQISRIESGRIKPQFCQVDINQMFKRLKEEFQMIAPQIKIEIICQKNEYNSEPLFIETDLEMLHQILTALVSNSVKFAGEQCCICLSSYKDVAGKIIICESDNGPGISQDALPHVFERFYRADESHTRRAGGCGLGLTITKNLCGLLGAEIMAGNVEPHGALFTLSFSS